MRFLVLAVVMALVAVSAPERLAAQGGSASNDVFDDWSQQAARSIIVTGAYGPPVAALHMAIVHLAMYDAVVAITGRYAPYSSGIPSMPGASAEAAVATAAHDVLLGLFPAQRAELDARLTQSLDRISGGRGKLLGADVGAHAATAILKARANDGRFAPVPYTPGTLVGMWAPTPPTFASYVGQWVGFVRPFAIRLTSQFRPPGPPALESSRYAEEYNEVKRLGSRTSAVRTAEQREIGLFWQDHGAAQANRTLLALSRARGLALQEKARLFAMVWTSGADAFIGCWNAKTYYSFWRPITAIHRAADDGNPATEADPTWEPLLPTPAFPEYPSGHTCFSGSVAESIETFFGTPDVPIVVDSALTNTTRRFAGAGDALNEVIEARIYIGYHFRSADVDGATLGRRTARYMLDRYFLPTSQ